MNLSAARESDVAIALALQLCRLNSRMSRASCCLTGFTAISSEDIRVWWFPCRAGEGHMATQRTQDALEKVTMWLFPHPFLLDQSLLSLQTLWGILTGPRCSSSGETREWKGTPGSESLAFRSNVYRIQGIVVCSFRPLRFMDQTEFSAGQGHCYALYMSLPNSLLMSWRFFSIVSWCWIESPKKCPLSFLEPWWISA